MENNNENIGGTNWTPPQMNTNQSNMGQQPTPNSMGAFVLGIISICTTVVLCCCYGYIIGLITSIIGLILGSGAIKTYNANPGVYTEASFRKAKTGRMLSIIGLILSLLVIAIVIVLVALKLSGNLPDEFERYERYNRNF